MQTTAHSVRAASLVYVQSEAMGRYGSEEKTSRTKPVTQTTAHSVRAESLVYVQSGAMGCPGSEEKTSR